MIEIARHSFVTNDALERAILREARAGLHELPYRIADVVSTGFAPGRGRIMLNLPNPVNLEAHVVALLKPLLPGPRRVLARRLAFSLIDRFRACG